MRSRKTDAAFAKKGPFIDGHLRVKIDALNTKNEKKVIKTWSRRSTILPDMIGHHDRRAQRAQVHSGAYITEQMVIEAQTWRIRPDANVQGASAVEEGQRSKSGQPLRLQAQRQANARRWGSSR